MMEAEFEKGIMKRFFVQMGTLAVLLAWVSMARAELIKGQVFLPDGTPAVKAEVWMEGYSSAKIPENMPLKLDAAGRFQVDIPSNPDWPDFFGRVVAFLPGYAPGGGALNKGENIFQLKPALPLQGRVVDNKAQPVAGVKIGLTLLSEVGEEMNRRFVALRHTPLAERLTAVSDANGVWRIDAGAVNYRATVEVQDPRFQRLTEWVLPGQEAVIRLLRGATLAGQVVYPDGKPATNVKVSAQASVNSGIGVNWRETHSDADGRFVLDGLSEMAYTVAVETSNEDWVVAPLENVLPKTGVNKTLPDLVFIKGAIVEGLVTDEKGAPVAGVGIGNYPSDFGAMVSRGESGKDGRYRLRIPPGRNTLRIVSQPRGFVNPQENSPDPAQVVEVEEGSTTEVLFKVRHGLLLSGTAKDRAGNPVKNVALTLKRMGERFENRAFAKSDEKGVWEVPGLLPGKWKIECEGEWDVISPLEIEMPATGAVNLLMHPAEYDSMQGRVVSFTGQPVEGVALKFHIATAKDERGMFTVTWRSVVSDARGEYEVGKLKRGVTASFQAAEKPGYQFSKGGVPQNGGGYDFSDIVMVAYTAQLAGRVVDAQGQPVENARLVSPDMQKPAAVVTDAQGRFLLENLAQGMIDGVVLHPEKGTVLFRQISDGADVVMRLTPWPPIPAQDIERAVALLGEDPGSGYDISWATLLPYDFERAVQLATKPDGTLHDGFVLRVITFLSRRDPGKALAWGVPRLDNIQDSRGYGYVLARLGLDVAPVNLQATRDLYDRLSAMAPPEGDAARYHLLYRAQLAARLKLPETQALVDEVLAAEQADEGVMGYKAMVAEALAPADLAQAKRILAMLQGNDKDNALRQVAQNLIRYGKLEELPDILQLLDAEQSKGVETNFGFAMTAVELIPVLGRTDPAAALALARRVQGSYHKPQALVQAALFQEPAAMRELLQEAAAAALAHQARVAELARIAVLTSAEFPELGREMTERALQLYREDSTRADLELVSGRENDVRNLAIALSLYDRMAARELLELTWIRLQRDTNQERTTGYEKQRIAQAMAYVDFERAVQMARSIPEDKYGQHYRREAIKQLARWVLTAPPKRPLLWMKNNGPQSNDEVD